MDAYRRRLPHISAPGVPTFVTWRLHGSLPSERVFHPELLAIGEAFVAFDHLLDNARSGPTYLRLPEIAKAVRNQILDAGSRALCCLHAYVIMPNHVHVLWTAEASLSALVRHVKGPTGRIANKLLGRTGHPFWQQEYSDRTVRNGNEQERIRRYIEWNPVKAGLAGKPEEYRWSSAYLGEPSADSFGVSH